jgi:hypothetical protein
MSPKLFIPFSPERCDPPLSEKEIQLVQLVSKTVLELESKGWSLEEAIEAGHELLEIGRLLKSFPAPEKPCAYSPLARVSFRSLTPPQQG